MRRVATWAGLAFGVLAMAVIVLYVAGLSVPREHTAVVIAELNAPPERIFAALVDVEGYTRWRALDSVEILSREPLRWREEGDDGPIVFELVERVEGARLVTRIADPELPFGGTWTYVLEPRGERTRLTITEEGFIDPPPFRLIMKYVIGYEATQREYLAQLATYLE